VTTSEEFKDLFENAPCGYLTMAPDGRITWVNQTLCAWTGYACDDFADKRVHQFLNMAGRIYFETPYCPFAADAGVLQRVRTRLPYRRR
jgi:phosphoserine phosphatase RsbU/P